MEHPDNFNGLWAKFCHDIRVSKDQPERIIEPKTKKRLGPTIKIRKRKDDED